MPSNAANSRGFLPKICWMSYKVIAIPKFARELKFLARKFPSLEQEFSELIGQLEVKPDIGTPLGGHWYKIRLSIALKGKGKPGGARVVTHVYWDADTVYLLSIYDKSDFYSIGGAELAELIDGISKR